MREDINKISYPKTKSEALEILPNMRAFFGNCEEYIFELNFADEDSVENISLLCDTYNDRIAIFRFYWIQDDEDVYSKAIDCVSMINLSIKDATRMADMLNYFVTIIENEH